MKSVFTVVFLLLLQAGFAQKKAFSILYSTDSTGKFTGVNQTEMQEGKWRTVVNLRSSGYSLAAAEITETHRLNDTTFHLLIRYNNYNQRTSFIRSGKSTSREWNSRDSNKVAFHFVSRMLEMQKAYIRQYFDVINPISKIRPDSVVAYAYEGKEENGAIILQGKLNKTVTGRHLLDSADIRSVGDFLSDTATFGETKAACFEPHLGIVYYVKGKPAAWFSICTTCNYLEASPWLPAETYMFEDGGEGLILLRNGFSEKGKNCIAEFCRKWGVGR